jgi:DNA polymerase
MTILWFDSETFSECDLKAHGTHRYAEAPSTEITVAQWAIDDGEPVVEDLSGGKPVSFDLAGWLERSDCQVVAHNSAFDRTLVRHCWNLDVPIERWRDTMVRALTHGLPGALGKIGPILGLDEDEQKDKRGGQLIQLFCKPRPKNMTVRRATRWTHPAEWAEFLEYSRQDIISMRAIDRALPAWNYQGNELALWHLDQRINDRGFAIDLDLARAAIAATEVEKARLKKATQEATNDLVSAPSKRDDLLAFILAEYGVDLPDMKADTLRRRLEDPELPDGVKLLISIRLEATKTSTAKYQTALKATSADGRMRNTMQFAGALRTSRWAHRLFQPGNMPRPSEGFNGEMQELVVSALKGGTLAEVASWM